MPQRNANILIAWCRLFRLPNLFTAPGDSLAGLFLASSIARRDGDIPLPQIVILACVSTLAYAYGTVLNDIADFEEDSRLRPERPLPSGKVSCVAASRMALTLVIATCAFTLYLRGMHATCCALAMLLTITAYDLHLKKYRFKGSLCMGLCRAFNYLLGVCASLDNGMQLTQVWPALVPFVAVTAYITSVTWLADRENETQTVGFSVQVPALAASLAWMAIILSMKRISPTLVLPAAFLLLTVFLLEKVALTLFRQNVPPHVMQPAIGSLLRPLVLWQITWILFSVTPPALFSASLLLIGWLCARKLARIFPQS